MTAFPSDPIRVLLADDHPLMRAGIAAALTAFGGIDIVAEAADGDQALACFLEQRPDVCVIDMQMPGMDGIATIRAIRAVRPDARIVVLTTFNGDARVAAAMAAGAAAYLLKDVSSEQLVATVREVRRGGTPIASQLRREGAHPTADKLSPRELDVLRLAACGQSNREIGVSLAIGEVTVKTHMSAILVKLGALDRAHAVALAARRGYITL